MGVKPSLSRTCEVQVDGAWRTASLAEGYGVYRDAPKRCPACHGAVYVIASYTRGTNLALAHRKLHTGCPLTPNTSRR